MKLCLIITTRIHIQQHTNRHLSKKLILQLTVKNQNIAHGAVIKTQFLKFKLLVKLLTQTYVKNRKKKNTLLINNNR